MKFCQVLAINEKNRSMFLESLFSTVLKWSYYETFSLNRVSFAFLMFKKMPDFFFEPLANL